MGHYICYLLCNKTNIKFIVSKAKKNSLLKSVCKILYFLCYQFLIHQENFITIWIQCFITNKYNFFPVTASILNSKGNVNVLMQVLRII